MAADFINVDTNRPLGAKLVRSSYMVLELRSLVDALSDAKDHMIDGADYSMFAANFGISPASAPNVATLLGYLHEVLNTPAEIAGPARLARFDEFVARLAGQ